MAITGSAVLDFGSAPGTTMVTTTVTGQGSILIGSNVEAYVMGNDSTATHNAIEHQLVPMTLRCGNIVAGTGFDIVASSEYRLSGTFAVRWVWA